MKLLRFILIASVVVISRGADGAPARFWISDRPTAPIIGEAPTITATQGVPKKLYIWGQPGTNQSGFRMLTDFSLNVVSQGATINDVPFVDFKNGSFEVYNDEIPTLNKDRFEYTFDSQTSSELDGPLVSAYDEASVNQGQFDAINGLKGMTIFSTEAVGIGKTNDPLHFMSGSEHAWRIAEFEFTPLKDSGANDLFLRIGVAGMRHEGDVSTLPTEAEEQDCFENTCVLFGNSSATSSLIYLAGPGMADRNITLPGDTYDIRINATGTPSSPPGDMDGDGSVGPEDYTYWLARYGNSTAPGTNGDASGDGFVNYLDYLVWRIHTPQSGSGASFAIPEPSSLGLVVAGIFMLLSRAISRCGR